MKVFVHSKREDNKSYLLHFNKEDITKFELRQLVEEYEAPLRLFKKSTHKIEVLPRDQFRAKMGADFVVGQEYTVERLG